MSLAKIGVQWPAALATLHAAALRSSVEERDYAATITACVRSLQWSWALRLLADSLAKCLKLQEPTWNKIVSAAGRKMAWQAAITLFGQYLENTAAQLTI